MSDDTAAIFKRQPWFLCHSLFHTSRGTKQNNGGFSIKELSDLLGGNYDITPAGECFAECTRWHLSVLIISWNVLCLLFISSSLFHIHSQTNAGGTGTGGTSCFSWCKMQKWDLCTVNLHNIWICLKLTVYVDRVIIKHVWNVFAKFSVVVSQCLLTKASGECKYMQWLITRAGRHLKLNVSFSSR